MRNTLGEVLGLMNGLRSRLNGLVGLAFSRNDRVSAAITFSIHHKGCSIGCS